MRDHLAAPHRSRLPIPAAPVRRLSARRAAALLILTAATGAWGIPSLAAQPKPLQKPPAPGPPPGLTAPIQGQQICVTAPRANLRAGPGAKYRVTWEVNRNMPLLQLAKDGEWIKVRDVDGDLHWVQERLVSSKRDCVTVRADRANIRKAPTNKADTWFTVEKYTSFHRVGQKENWVKIEYEGETMWVAQSLVWPT